MAESTRLSLAEELERFLARQTGASSVAIENVTPVARVPSIASGV